jgi:hypothetical protein
MGCWYADSVRGAVLFSIHVFRAVNALAWDLMMIQDSALLFLQQHEPQARIVSSRSEVNACCVVRMPREGVGGHKKCLVLRFPNSKIEQYVNGCIRPFSKNGEYVDGCPALRLSGNTVRYKYTCK